MWLFPESAINWLINLTAAAAAVVFWFLRGLKKTKLTFYKHLLELSSWARN
jgi:hypothetical protein